MERVNLYWKSLESMDKKIRVIHDYKMDGITKWTTCLWYLNLGYTFRGLGVI